MDLTFDTFVGAFLSKISEYEFMQLPEDDRTAVVDGLMLRALTEFKYICKYDLSGNIDRDNRCFDVEVLDSDMDEIVEIVSEGMIVQWLKPYVYQQELMQEVLNTKDFTTYSPAEILLRVGGAYDRAMKNYTQKIREYSYNNGDLSNLHL